MSDRIDDPIDASLAAFPSEPKGMGDKFGDLALKLSALVFPPIAVGNILRDYFSQEKLNKRTEYLYGAFVVALKHLETELATEQQKVKAVQERLDSPQFQEAIATAFNEAVRATNTKTVERMASVLAGSLAPNQWGDPKADLAAMIRDVAQLGEQDILVLELLRTAFQTVIAHLPNLNDPNQFAEKIDDYRTTMGLAAIEQEDFYGACARLSGFGLALEVVRNATRMRPHEYMFRPTRRGLALLDSLDKFGSTSKAAQ